MKKLLFSIVLLTITTLSYGQLLDSTTVYFEGFEGSVSVSLLSNISGKNWAPQTMHPTSACTTLAASGSSSYYIGRTSTDIATGKVRMATPAIPLDPYYSHIYLSFDHICKAAQLIGDLMKVSVEFSSDGINFYDNNEFISPLSPTVDNYGSGSFHNSYGYSSSSYSTWNGSTPTNSWWKSELMQIGRALHNSPNAATHYRIVFMYHTLSQVTVSFAGWFVDNIKIVHSNAEIFPPVFTWQPTHYSNLPAYRVNGRDNIGPYTIKARLVDKDTVLLDSIRLTYTKNNDGIVYSLEKDTISGILNTNGHTVNVAWVMPSLCYGDTVWYRIDYQDVHGNASFDERDFSPYSSAPNVTTNDAGLLDFYNMPWSFYSNMQYDIEAILHNRSLNYQTDVNIAWSVNDSLYGNIPTWHGSLCMDHTDTISLPTAPMFIRPHKLGWNDFKAWIVNRNNTIDNGIVENDTIRHRAYVCAGPLNGPYTMGRDTSDFPTLQHFKDRLWYCEMSGPVTINIMPGTYESFTFDSVYRSMSDTNYVVFQSATGNPDDVIIMDNAASTVTTSAALTIKNTDYFRFNNLTFQGKTSTTSSRGINFTGQGCKGIQITNCKINVANNYTGVSNTHVGIGRTISVTAPGSGNPADVDKIYLKDNTITGGVYGIYYTGSSNVNTRSILNVEGNKITSSYRGVYIYYCKAPIIEKNNLYSLNNDASSEVEYTGIHLERVDSVSSISKNKISSMRTLYGIYLTYVTPVLSTDSVILSNNAIYTEFNATGSAGIELHASNRVSIINNTVLTYSYNILEKTAAFEIKSGPLNNITLQNNIFINQCRSTTNANYATYINTLPSDFLVDYNCYYSDGYNIGYYTVPRASISDWRHAMSGQEANSISRLPDFELTDDDSLLNMNEFDGFECFRHPKVLNDIKDNNRDLPNHMGAYAVNAVNTVNLYITHLASPQNTLCPNGTYDFNVAVKNIGGQVIFSPTNSLQLIATYSGAINRVDTVYYFANDTLAPMEELIVTLGTHALPINSLVDLEVVINMPNDYSPESDTLRTSCKIDVISLDNTLGHNEYEETFSNHLTNPLWKIEQINGAGNWIVEQGTGTNPAIAPIYGTGRLYFNAKNFGSNPQPISRIYLPTISLVNAENPVMEIWYAHDPMGSGNQRTGEGIIVRLSTDESSPNITLRPKESSVIGDTLLKRYKAGTATSGVWTKYTYELSTWDEQSCVRIAIDARGYAGNNINIDRILIRNVLSSDCMVNDFYYYSEAPTEQQLSTRVKAKISNIGAFDQDTVRATLTISGANTYTETISNISITSQQEKFIYFNGTDLDSIGENTITVSLGADQNYTNNSLSKILPSYANRVSYSDTSTSMIAIGSNTSGYNLVNRVNVDEEIIVTAIRFYPISQLDAVGKRILAFSADQSGTIRAYSDTLTITTEMVNTWVEMPLINYALTNVSDCFYAGIRLVDPGFYIGAQLESPLRDSVFYVMSPAGAYSAQISGKAMIGAVIDRSVTQELGLLNLMSPRTNCDLGHENITIQFTNNGSQTIPEGAVFHCVINDVIHYVDTLRETVLRSETKTFTFSDHPNMTNNVVGYDSSFTFHIWVERVENDRINFNDTLLTNIISYGKSNLPIVTDTTYVNYYTSTNLTAQYPSSIPTGALSWFANTGFENWELLHQGDVFTTPVIFYDTAFYVNVAPGHLAETTVGTVSNSANMQPFMFSNGYARGRILYTATDLGADRGNISKIALNVHAAAPANITGIPIKIYVKNTTLTTFANGTNFTWSDEIADALLIYDGNLVVDQTGWMEFQFPEVFEYTGDNVIFLTETNCNGSCGTPTPTFKISAAGATNTVQYCVNETNPRFTNSANRFVMKFYFSNLNCASEKVPIQVIVPDRPIYDVETIDLTYPLSNPSSSFDNCNLEWENIQVTVRNMLNEEIPANKVMVHATFNGSSISHLVNEAFAPLETKMVTFTTPFNFTAATANITFNYVISTDILEEDVYRLNDTVRGSLISYRTDYFPDVIDTLGEYSQPFTIKLDNTNRTCFFYDSETATTTIANGNRVQSYSTGNLFDTVTYWVEALNSAGTNPRCTTKRIQYNINIIVPDHDLKMISFNSPGNFECGVTPNLDVTVENTKDAVIPTGTFKVKADFTGTATHSFDYTINTTINGLATVDIPFTTPTSLGSTTINNIYNYKIHVDPIDPTMTIYHNNDTIDGELKVPANPIAPPALTFNSVPYGTQHPIVPLPTASPLNYFYFYDHPTAGNLIWEGNSYTTPEVYATQTYYYSGRITQPEFANSITLGTSSTSTTFPFNFTSTSGISQGIILYTAAEMGNYAGKIDSISWQTLLSAYGEIPVKLYMLNDTRTTLPAGSYDFNSLKASAQLIYDASTDFIPTNDWFRIGIPGGFDYTGGSLLVLTEHDCNGGSCENIGVSPTPTFKSSAVSQRVVYRTSTTSSFAASNNRINTRFYMNYTCESPRSQIRVSPNSVPACELMLTRIENPVTPKNPYTSTEQVKVHIKNYGTSAASGFKVGCILDGVLLAEEDYSGTIASNGTGIHTFSGTFDFSDIYFATEFKVYIAYTCDNFRRNDTASIYLKRPDPCISRATSPTGALISNFTMAGVSTGSGIPIFSYVFPADENGSYTNYTLDPSVPIREVVQGQFYPFSITNSWTTPTATTLYKYIYIDLNRDNEFSASERMFYTPTAITAPTPTNTANATTMGMVTIPESATPGVTLMRVITAYGSNAGTTAGHPCTPYAYGETEDYAINILNPYTNDMGIHQIFHPSGNICADTNGRIRIVIKNFGSSAQYFTEEIPLQLTATVTGAIPAVYTKTVTSGFLTEGEIMTIIIDDVDFSAVGDYTVVVNMTYASDLYLVNNQATSYATVENATVWNFIQEEFYTENFGAMWTAENTNSNYRWTIHQGQTGNNPNAGPTHDHTVGEPSYGAPEGLFAAVSAPSNASSAAVATLTTGCINLHYQHDYPMRLIYWHHIFGINATATTKFYVQVGSGDNFYTVDSLTNRTQTSTDEPWLKRLVNFTNMDEVACIRFMVTDHGLLIDPAIDDISLTNGFPDIGIDEIVHPKRFDDPEQECLIHSDSVQMIVRIKNYGSVPVSDFDISGKLEIGLDVQHFTERIPDTLLPGESMDYQFVNKLITSRLYDHNAFIAETLLEHDGEPNNNIKTNIACLDGTKVDDYDSANGVYLGQNIPNPANMNTVIPFFIPQGGQVKFTIHSAEGQLLYTHESTYDTGEHQLQLSTDKFANGLYFYTLYFNNVMLSKKMVIQKQ